MQNRDRITLEVEIDLDPMPGNMHTPESVERAVYGLLHMRAGHYNPEVRVQVSPPEEDISFLNETQKINYLALQIAMRRFPDADSYELNRAARKIADGIRRGF